MLDRLAGMFAFCLVEHESGRAVLARDRLGKKPLYLQELGDGGCGWRRRCPRSSPRAGWIRGCDPVALHHYLSFHSIVPAPRTILRGVRKLPPATVMVVEPDGAAARAALLGSALRARARGLVPRRAGRRPCSTLCGSQCGGGW
jgi:asparagine synthase (glutamine-hydrolysing)